MSTIADEHTKNRLFFAKIHGPLNNAIGLINITKNKLKTDLS